MEELHLTHLCFLPFILYRKIVLIPQKKKRLDFNSFLGLYFSAITIYLCVKIMLNMSLKGQNDPFFNHGKDHDSSEAEYLLIGSPLDFCCGAENKGVVLSVLPLLKSGVLKLHLRRDDNPKSSLPVFYLLI